MSKSERYDATKALLGLRVHRQWQGRSLRSVAKAVGLAPTQLSEYERGLTRPRIDTYLAIAAELGLIDRD